MHQDLIRPQGEGLTGGTVVILQGDQVQLHDPGGQGLLAGLLGGGHAGLHVSPAGEVELPGVAVMKNVAVAHIQAGGAGDHDQNHGGQDANGGQASAVLLHPVEHTAHGDEVIGFVVIALHPTQQLQNHHAPGDEAGVGAQNHQNHSHKEPDQGVHRVLDGDGQPVACAQEHKAHQSQEPIGPEQHEGGIEQKDAAGAQEGPGDEFPCIADLKLEHVAQQQLRQLAQENAQAKAHQDAGAEGKKGLPEQDPANVPLLHAQNVVQAKLPLPPLHQKAVGVKQEDEGENLHHVAAQVQNGVDNGALGNGLPGICIGEAAEDEMEHDHEDAGEHVGQVKLPVLPQVGKRQLVIEALMHGAHHLSGAWSGCRKSAGTAARRSRPHGRAGGRSARPG